MKFIPFTSNLLFLAFFMLSGLSQTSAKVSLPDSSILQISLHDFNNKLDKYTDFMREESDFSEEEYIEMVMIDNTYTMFMRNSNPNYKVQAHKEYLDLIESYMDDIVQTLEATEQGCNGGFYSPKHELCIGGTEPSSKSMFLVVE